jgi:hypothetical protein
LHSTSRLSPRHQSTSRMSTIHRPRQHSPIRTNAHLHEDLREPGNRDLPQSNPMITQSSCTDPTSHRVSHGCRQHYRDSTIAKGAQAQNLQVHIKWKPVFTFNGNKEVKGASPPRKTYAPAATRSATNSSQPYPTHARPSGQAFKATSFAR